MKTIESVIVDFLSHCRYEKNLGIKTIKAYGTDLRQFLQYLHLHDYSENIEEIDKIPIKGYLQELSTCKPKTIKRKIATIKAMFNFIEYEDVISINPFRKIRIQIKEPKELPRVMTILEVKSIFRKAYLEKKDIKDKTSYRFGEVLRNIAALELLFSTGIRVAELCSLKPENIDLKAGIICVNGKGSKERIIQVCNNEAKQALFDYMKIFSNKIRDANYFFVNRHNRRLSEQSVRFMIKKYASKCCNQKNITPHTFRHTFATLLLEENIDIKYIQHILGHSSIMTTQIYTHVNSEKQKKILTNNNPRKNFKAMDFF